MRAWCETDEFRVIYSWTGGRRVGIIRNRETTIDRMDVYATGDIATPEEFGQEVADFNIGEPLGAYGDILDVDADGLGWWGHIPLCRRSLPPVDGSFFGHVLSGPACVSTSLVLRVRER